MTGEPVIGLCETVINLLVLASTRTLSCYLTHRDATTSHRLTTTPWRDLPPEFGNWNSTFRQFRRWTQADVFKRIFDVPSDESGVEYAMTDATIAKVHQHGKGAQGLLCGQSFLSLQLHQRPFCTRAASRGECNAMQKC